METKALNEKTLLEQRDEAVEVYEDIRTGRLPCGGHAGWHLANLEAKINGLNKQLYGDVRPKCDGLAAFWYIDYLKSGGK